MRRPTIIALEPRLIDVQIIDKNGVRCGKVDDLLFDGGVGKRIKVKAILVGPNAYYSGKNGVLRWILSKIIREQEVVKIPWKNVSEIFPLVKLNATAEKIGLGKYDGTPAQWLRRIPGS